MGNTFFLVLVYIYSELLSFSYLFDVVIYLDLE